MLELLALIFRIISINFIFIQLMLFFIVSEVNEMRIREMRERERET